MSRRNRHGLQRRQNRRNLRKTFLIVCEGSKTEPNYFEGFRVPREIYDVKGMGDNTIRLVREAIKLKEQGNYDQVWVVMDKDDFPVDHFNGAIEMARAKNICVAYSNEAFELWYLLHFDYHNTAVSRRTYRERLSKRLGFSYEKNNPRMYELLEDRQPVAMQNARRLLDVYSGNSRPAYDNPSTTVHLLVEQLREASV
ncbi:MAG: RloB domain-containing protein [Ardenticatenales bacterium]|nr:RloB domain-containing protein [Ardenticatenales bacterium]